MSFPNYGTEITMHSRRILRLLPALSLWLLSSTGCLNTETVEASQAAEQTSDAGPDAQRAIALQFLVRDAHGEVTQLVDKVVFGEQVVVRAQGLRPGTTVTLRAAAASVRQPKRATIASASFVVDRDGVVDTGKQAPTSGTYSDVDADGLFWSMADAAMPAWMDTEPFAATIAVEADGHAVAKRTLHRLAFAEDVTCEPVSTAEIFGSYCAKRGAPKRTPVLAFGGSEGGSFAASWLSMVYASWGIPTLGVAYFGAGTLPRELKQIPLEYFEGAMKWLDSRPEARPGETIVSGGSRGGELALLLGATYPRVIGVIADAPSSFTWASLDAKAAAWTHHGVDIPFVPRSASAAPEEIPGPGGTVALRMTPMFERSVSDASPADIARTSIAIEKTNGPVLLLAGARDDLWPSCDFSKRAHDRLVSSGHSKQHPDEVLCFADAGHAISFVGGPTTDAMWSTMGVTTLSLGGTARGIARAKRAADDKRHAFLELVSRR